MEVLGQARGSSSCGGSDRAGAAAAAWGGVHSGGCHSLGQAAFGLGDEAGGQVDEHGVLATALRQMVGIFAELDRRTTVKRMRDGIRAKAAEGRHATGQYRYGYEGAGKGRARDAAPRTDEQAAVARIVELRTDGESYWAIAVTLDAEGHRPRRAAAWSAMAVRSVAQREMGERATVGG